MTFKFDKSAPILSKLKLADFNIEIGIDVDKGYEYINSMGNIYVYQDGVNYVSYENNNYKFEGPMVLTKSEEGSDTETIDELSGVELDNVMDGVTLHDVTIKDGIISIEGTMLGDNGEEVNCNIKVNKDTNSVVALSYADLQSTAVVSIECMNEWNVLPNVEFKDTDVETITTEAESVLFSIVGAMFGGAFQSLE